MNRRFRRPLRRSRTAIGVTVAASVVASVLSAAPVAAAYSRKAPPVQRTKPVRGTVAGVEPAARNLTAEAAARPRTDTAWPAPGAGTVDVPGRGAVARPAGTLPVRVAAPRRGTAPRRVAVDLSSPEQAAERGARGLLLTVRRADGGTVAAPVDIEVDYSTFANAIGGDWGSRLRLTTADGKPVPTTNDSRARKLRATVQAAPDAGTSTLAAAESGPVLAAAESGPSMLTTSESGTMMLAAGASGDAGDYTATSLGASAAWQVNTQNGDFSWSYPFRVPPGVNGPTPALGMGYSSGSVDGRTAGTNAQTSWLGEGHSMEWGYVERKYVSCSDDMANGALNTTKTGDLCWRSDNATIALAGHSGDLVKDSATGTWKLENDDSSKLEKLTGGSNTDNDTEYWKLTTTDGTQYFFGLGKRYATDTAATNSTWTVPVFGNHTGEPCKTTTWSTSYCTQAWRWNLSYVVDPHGNTMTYFYTPETNKYGRNNNTAIATYDRGGYLARIEYGERKGTEATTNAAAQVAFTVKERCVTATTSTFNCESTTPTATNASNWPDVPVDQICTDTDTSPGCPTAPTFFTRKRLTQVQTKYWNAALTTPAYSNVDTWALTQTFPSPGDGSGAAMWLDSVQHTGNVGTAITMPKVTFAGVTMPNRVDGVDGSVQLNKYRVSSITSETGATVSVNYHPQECVAGTNMPSSPESNTKRCFPVFYTQPGASSPTIHWFHKYVVQSVVDDDKTGSSEDKVATYAYLGSPAWHYDDNELTQPKYRTYGDYRGYEKVRVTLGEGTTQSVTESTYLRGMDGDRLPGGAVRDITVVDSENVAIDDHPRLSGALRESRQLNGAAEVSGAIFDPWISAATATNGSDKAYLLGNARTRSRVALASGGYRRSEVETTYDSYGMAVLVDDLGDVTKNTDDLCSRTTYVRNTSLWIVDSVSRTETVSVRCSATTARPADVVSDSRVYYDGATSLTTAPTRGLPTKTEILDSWPVTGPVYKQKNRVTYDVHGRLLDTFDALDRKTSFAYTPTTGGPVTQMTETNPKLHVNTTTLHPAWGATTAELDANARRTDLTYDALGRLTQVWTPARPMNSNLTSPNMKFSYLVRNNGPVVVTTQELRNDGTYTSSNLLYDGLLRPRQTQRPSGDGGRVLTDTVYDSRGLVAAQNGPYYATGAPGTSLLVVSDAELPAQTKLTYDGANRLTASVFYVRAAEKWRTTTEYGGDHVRVDPPEGATPTVAYTDARGRTTELREYHGSAPTGTAFDATTYEYFPDGQAKSVHDAAGNTWSYTYDLRGRMTTSVDPDRGTTVSTYDVADRVVTTEDARHKVVEYAYDELDRRTSLKDVATGTVLSQWTYDTVTNGKGKAATSTRFYNGAAYETKINGYDALYRPTSSTFTVPQTDLTPSGLSGPYTTSLQYNIDGGLKMVGQPSAPGLPAENVTIGYDALGRGNSLTGASSYVGDTIFSPYGETLQLSLGSTIGKSSWQTFEYEEGTRRLQRARVDRETTVDADSDLRFGYDHAGNVLKVADVPLNGTTNETECFDYDHLQRLVEAWTATDDCAAMPSMAVLGGPAPYWTSYTYDVTGNRTSEVQHATGGDTTRTYAYPAAGAARPHALTSVTTTPPAPATPTTETFDHDDTGNLTSRKNGTESLVWDVEGNLESMTTAQGQTRFLYDANGDRIVRKDPTGTTLYLDGTEIRLTASNTVESTRYYSLNGRTIASRVGGDIETLATDHHGTAYLSIDNSTMAVSRRRFTPFGAPRGTATGTWMGERSFVGGTSDASTGLVHLGAREYDPALGRFISVDPIIDFGDSQQMNGYAYSNNSPITYSDPDGLLYGGDGGGGGGSSTSSTKTSSSGGTSQTQKPAASKDNAAWDTVRSDEAPWTAQKEVEVAVNVARGRQEESKSKLKNAVGTLLKIAADELGITAAVNCFTQGDMGACGEMAVNIVMSFVGGIAGKLLKKYGAPWKWKSGLKLVNRIWNLASEAVGALRGLFKVQGELKSLVKQADELADQAASHVDEVADGASCAVGNSFTGETPILLGDGTTIPIAEIDVGDLVLATDPRTGESGPRAVTTLIVHGGVHTMVDVSLSDGTTIEATDHHPFWNERSQRYVDAVNLREGSKVRTASGSLLEVTGTRVYEEDVVAHNLTVDDLHTYYAGTTPVLVHNCGEIPGRPFRGRSAPQEAFKHLERHHGVDPKVAGNRLHKLKETGGLGAADDVAIGRTGDVYDSRTGDRLGSLTDKGLGTER